MEARRNIQQSIDTIKEATTSIIPKDKLGSFINPVIIIVITTKHTSIGNSNIKLPQSFFSQSLDIKYLSSSIFYLTYLCFHY